MQLTDELQQLSQLHAQGSLSDQEFATAKTRLLTGPTNAYSPAAVAGTRDQLEQLHHDALIAQLDREWALEREQYMVVGRYGRSLPNENLVGAMGIFAAIFGVCWTVIAAVLFFPFALFGMGITAIIIASTVSALKKAKQYPIALARYEQRRAELLRQATPNR